MERLSNFVWRGKRIHFSKANIHVFDSIGSFLTWASGEVAIWKIRIVEHLTVLHLPLLLFHLLYAPPFKTKLFGTNGCSSLTLVLGPRLWLDCWTFLTLKKNLPTPYTKINLTLKNSSNPKRVELALCLHSICVFLSHQSLCFCCCVLFISFLPSFSFTIYLVTLLHSEGGIVLAWCKLYSTRDREWLWKLTSTLPPSQK